MKYRMLRSADRPDKRRGDQFEMHRGYWVTTSLRGKRTLDDCHRAGNPCAYRRPANAGVERTQKARTGDTP